MGLVVNKMCSINRSTPGHVSNWISDRRQTSKSYRYVTSHPGQLGLAIPQSRCNEYQRQLGRKQAHRAIDQPLSVVWRCKLVSGCGLRKRRSAPRYGSYRSGVILRFFHVLQRRSVTTVPMATRRCWQLATVTWPCFRGRRPSVLEETPRRRLAAVRGYCRQRPDNDSTLPGDWRQQRHSLPLPTRSTTVNSPYFAAFFSLNISLRHLLHPCTSPCTLFLSRWSVILYRLQ